MLTRGSEAGKEVKRNLVVVGEDVSTLSVDSKVVSNTVLATVVPVLFHFELDFAVPSVPGCLVGVKAGGSAAVVGPKIELSIFVEVLGGDIRDV